MPDFSIEDHEFMQHAFELAKKAEEQDEVPVGAVLVRDNKIIGEGFNSPITTNDPTAHAEINALRNAALKERNYRLPKTTLYVTLEPCAMCAGALVHSRVDRLVYAAKDEKTGACGSLFDVISTNNKMHRVRCEHGLLSKHSSELISNFFKRRRAEKKLLN